MINKRLLIKNLLSHYGENSFYDKKRQLNLHTKEGKSKFVKHICALSNSNPDNNSYMVVGVEDEDNKIVGVDFFDDSKIQNLIDAYLDVPPQISYDNVMFPSLPEGKVIGLVTIRPQKKLSRFKKNVFQIEKGTSYVRIGSNSIPNAAPRSNRNKEVVDGIENMSKNNMSTILDGVLTFMMGKHKDIESHYVVFNELFVVCWAGIKKRVREKTHYSRVDIELINEQIKLFYSALDAVRIHYDEEKFVITEYVKMGLNDRTSYYPFEEVSLYFYENGSYDIKYKVLFQAPQYNRKILDFIYEYNLCLIGKLEERKKLTLLEEKRLSRLPHTMMLCYLNDFREAKERLIQAKPLLKRCGNPKVYDSFKEVMRILRKLKYEV